MESISNQPTGLLRRSSYLGGAQSSQRSSDDDCSSSSGSFDEENGSRIAENKNASSSNRRCCCIILLVIVLVTAASFVIVRYVASNRGRSSGVKTSGPVKSSVDTPPFFPFDFGNKSKRTPRQGPQGTLQEGVVDATASPIHVSNKIETKEASATAVDSADLVDPQKTVATPDVEIKNEVEKKSVVQRLAKWTKEKPVEAATVGGFTVGLVANVGSLAHDYYRSSQHPFVAGINFDG